MPLGAALSSHIQMAGSLSENPSRRRKTLHRAADKPGAMALHVLMRRAAPPEASCFRRGLNCPVESPPVPAGGAVDREGFVV